MAIVKDQQLNRLALEDLGKVASWCERNRDVCKDLPRNKCRARAEQDLGITIPENTFRRVAKGMSIEFHRANEQKMDQLTRIVDVAKVVRDILDLLENYSNKDFSEQRQILTGVISRYAYDRNGNGDR